VSAAQQEVGIVCGQCDSFNAMGAASCTSCGHGLSLFPQQAGKPTPPPTPAPPSKSSAPQRASAFAKLAMGGPKPKSEPPVKAPPPSVDPPTLEPATTPIAAKQPRRTAAIVPAEPSKLHPEVADEGPTVDYPGSPAQAPEQFWQVGGLRKADAGKSETPFSQMSQEELMEQAKYYVCRSCSSTVPRGHKFCGKCGTPVPPEILNAQTLFFGDMQNPAKAKLILIRGEGMDGLSFHLKAEQHIVGTKGQLPFEDAFISPRHANFFYRDSKLVVRDESSLNGVFVRIRGTVEIAPGDTFLAGEQLFRIDPTPRASDGQDPDGTYFYSSPKHPSPFRLAQLLQGGSVGMVVCARGSSIQVGREGGDLNFPVDLYMSSSHCRIEEVNGKFTLTDMGSRNGTYVRIKGERELAHGDYIFLGRKLLRVEMNSN